MKPLNEIIICACYNVEHIMIFRTIEGDSNVYVSYHLSKLPWYKRIVHAVKYIFGYTSMYGDFDELILDSKSISKLKKVIKYLETNHNPIK